MAVRVTLPCPRGKEDSMSREKERFLPAAGEGPADDQALSPAPERKYPCPCCGNLTFPVPKEEAAAYICPVCFWENDVFTPGEEDKSDENRGMTLKQGRENYRRWGAVREDLVRCARPPEEKEKPMKKKLSEMTLQELWQLFPIFLTEHRDCWEQWFREKQAELAPLLPPGSSISHIGSTAVRGIWAKPIVDLLIEVPDPAGLETAKAALSRQGYTMMSENENRASFNQGYTEEGFAEKVFHLHLRLQGDHDELYFRDYLNACPEAAREYEALKLRLWKEYEHDRDEYTRQKTEFVKTRTALAKKLFPGKYEE